MGFESLFESKTRKCSNILRNNQTHNTDATLMKCGCSVSISTVKPVLRGHLKIHKTKVLMENGSLMKIENIAECSPWSNLQYF